MCRKRVSLNIYGLRHQFPVELYIIGYCTV